MISCSLTNSRRIYEFVKPQLIIYVSNVFHAVKEAEEYFSSLHGLTMKKNTAPHSLKEDIYDEVELSEYERNRAHLPQARATVKVGVKPHVIVKCSSTWKAVALITGGLTFLLLITILILVSVPTMCEKQGKISCRCLHDMCMSQYGILLHD